MKCLYCHKEFDVDDYGIVECPYCCNKYYYWNYTTDEETYEEYLYGLWDSYE